MPYESLTEFERKIAKFSDNVNLITALQVGGKLTPEEAYKEIKFLWKGLKKYRKGLKSDEY